ncbi:MAG TPA: DNA-3-methyladenine glycosylase [Candidatus Nanoarchaeia archaeon]|nr:DNA-3-methyladenine glycosylase [Candidatus Nanoarchaeia archaeon]
MKQLPQSFFGRDTVKVARDLLGKIISVNGFTARIVETEAYGTDPASHAFKRTERSALMYDTYGHVYIYLIYGMYHCINFTTEKDNPGAVLIRAVEPLNKIKALKQRRKNAQATELCSGPGKLCQALGIDRTMNGLKLGRDVKVYDDNYPVKKISSSSRIGIKDAQELPWRFYISDNEYVSRRYNKNP